MNTLTIVFREVTIYKKTPKNIDNPNTFGSVNISTDAIPNTESPDNYNYFINTPINIYKRIALSLLEFHWLHNDLFGLALTVVHSMTKDDEKLVLVACVRHSQSVTTSPFKPLVAVQKWNYYLQQAQERPVLIWQHCF